VDQPRDKIEKAAQRAKPESTSKREHGLDAGEVVAFLKKHPDFLDEHAELIPLLTPPAMQHGEGVLDMQHFMLQRLRSEVARLKGQQRALIATSRSNLSSQSRVHQAVLAVIGAVNFEQLIQVVTTDLAIILDVDVVTIGVERAEGPRPRLPHPGVQLLRAGMVDALLGERDALLRSDIQGDPALFGGAAGLVRSEALFRLHVSAHAPVGLLCIGTRRPDKFHPGQGTELLAFLARTVEKTIAAWLDLAA
jgi:uncharacterized protein YigA (DUF484 family)